MGKPDTAGNYCQRYQEDQNAYGDLFGDNNYISCGHSELFMVLNGERVALYKMGQCNRSRVNSRGGYNNRHVWYTLLYTCKFIFPAHVFGLYQFLLFDVTRLLPFNKSTKIMD